MRLNDAMRNHPEAGGFHPQANGGMVATEIDLTEQSIILAPRASETDREALKC